MIIDIEGYTEPIFSKPIKQAEGETNINCFVILYILLATASLID
jgi:hypothetical protein